MNRALAIRTKSTALQGGLDLYLRQLGNFPVLSREEERKIADLWYEKRDRDAGQKLVISNLRFVVKIAREYSKYGLKMNDLIQEGNLGLMHAVDKFDPRRGFRLISYAVWWIRAYIQSFILKSWSVVRMGTTRAQRKIFNGLQKARRKIASLNEGAEVEKKQIAEVLNVSEKDLNETLVRMKVRDISTDQPVSKNRSTSVGELLTDDRQNAEEKVIALDLQNRVRGTLDEAYEDLSPRERFLLDKRLMSDSPVTLAAAGHEFGVSRERVRQIEARLKTKLRTLLAPAVGEAA